MPTWALVLGLIFVILGTWLLLTRLLHQCWIGEFWNNTPLALTWGVTVLCAGAAVALVGFVTAFEKCEGDCERSNGNTGGSSMVAGAIVAVIGLCFMFCPCCCQRDPKTIYYDWETKQDNRGVMSGVDFVALGIGLAILATEQAMGQCPRSCAQAVVVLPGNT